MDWSTSSFTVQHQLLELAKTHVHWAGDTNKLSHPLSSPSPPAFYFCQHQGLFQWVSSLHQVAKALELQLQHQSLMNIQGWFPLGLTGLIWAFTQAFLLPATLPASSFSLAHLTEASGLRQHFFLTEASLNLILPPEFSASFSPGISHTLYNCMLNLSVSPTGL